MAQWKPSKDAASFCDGRVEECFCTKLDDNGRCLECGSTADQRKKGESDDDDSRD